MRPLVLLAIALFATAAQAEQAVSADQPQEVRRAFFAEAALRMQLRLEKACKREIGPGGRSFIADKKGCARSVNKDLQDLANIAEELDKHRSRLLTFKLKHGLD